MKGESKYLEAISAMYITGIILAAGTSSRMGGVNKLLLPFKKHTVIEEVLKQLSDSAVNDIVVITGHDRTRIEEHLDPHMTARISLVYNADYRLGRAESIKCAIRNLPEKADAAMFMVADKPGVTHALTNRAIDLFKKKIPAILYVETPAGRGHPIIFSRTVFDDLLKLRGDIVGDELVVKYAHSTIVLKDGNPQLDIDTEDDYRILLGDEPGR